ncbi:MAG: hypothetical protein JXJ22_14645 [Bacteroidales bacterium]|nr:hypothetical protein [Bacteroidales bacterium]
MKNRNILFVYCILFIFGINVYSKPVAPEDSLMQQNTLKEPRIYNTMCLTTEKPVIDGVLDDVCWQTGEWAGDFTQWIPNEGAKASQPTILKVLYDDKSVYIAIRAFDSEPDKIDRKAGRRDEFNGDIVGVCFDSYHDHRTGFEFDVTAAGQKCDVMLTNPSNPDMNWNAVWYGKTAAEDSAWTVEIEVPFSQLRYSADEEQVWGMHCWRWINRLQEESDWEPQSSTGPGMLYLFGEMHGISGLKKSRRIEIMPYGLGKLNTFEKNAANPFAQKGYHLTGDVGLDAKIGLSSNFTVDLTINPDFGQVESDPSVMNLTAFETFYEEKRPFFLEGSNIFKFEFDDDIIFYSRRIGHTPSFRPDLNENEYLDFPDNTTILNAEKFSGKTSKGLSVGVIHSITSVEHATLDTPEGESKFTAEPLTSYLVARLQKDFNQSNTMLGGIFTSTNRFIRDDYLEYLNRVAYTGGFDLLHYWKEKEYYIDAKFTGSLIKGEAEAIKELQTASARYFQRPDAGYLNFDTTLTQLSGFGGKIKIGKGSKGLWRYSAEVNWRTPGFDLNDIGYMQTSDQIRERNNISYFVNKPVSIFRTYSVGLFQENYWNFGLDHLSSGAGLHGYFEFLNKWAVSPSVNYYMSTLDTRILRGGPAMITPGCWSGIFNIRTDGSKKLFFFINNTFSKANSNRLSSYSAEPGITVQPFSSLRSSLNLIYASNIDQLQYVDTKEANNNYRYILGKVNQETLGLTFKVDFIITPEISLQYYGSPFASVGKFTDFKNVTNPKEKEYKNRFENISDISLEGEYYQVDENNDDLIDYTFKNPDFNFYQFRSNLVFRWEYRPGSQLYIVWSNDKTDYLNPGSYELNDMGTRIAGASPNNIFLIKLNYWFSL